MSKLSKLFFYLLFATMLLSQGHSALALTNYAAGKPATVTPAFPLTYWANKDASGNELTAAGLHARLTDGVTADIVQDTSVSPATDNLRLATSWTTDNTNPTLITLDLQAVKSDIGSVRVDNPVKGDFGPKHAQGIKAYGSEDGTNFQLWGSLSDTVPFMAGKMGENMNHIWVWNGKPRTARYVRFEFTWSSPGSGTESIFELSVFAADPNAPALENYALDKTVVVTPEYPTDYWANDADLNVLHARLTDGNVAASGTDFYLGAAWTSSEESVRQIVVNLGSVKTDIRRVQVGNLVDPSGPKRAKTIVVSGSSDGVTYTRWGALSTADASSSANYIWTWTGGARTAQYVKFEFTFLFPNMGTESISELRVLGGTLYGSVLEDVALFKPVTPTPEYPTDYWGNGTDLDALHARLTDSATYPTGSMYDQAASWTSEVGTARTLVVDLQAVETDLVKVQIDNLQNSSTGPKLATSIAVSGSSDGTTYTPWGSLSCANAAEDANCVWTWTGDAQSARYVKFELAFPNPGQGMESIYELYVFKEVGTPAPPVLAVAPTHWSLY